MQKTAILSDDPNQLYRYGLTRRWEDGPSVGFIMLNPSTADADVDDPTIRRCIGFAKEWGYGAIEVVNLFARRATDPGVLYECENPTGPNNWAHLTAFASRVDLIVAAWGVHGALFGQGEKVRKLLEIHHVLYHLGLTKDGHPRHPLYLKKDTRPKEWRR